MVLSRRKKIYDMTKGRCTYCGCKLDFDNFHVDHVVPQSKGGKNRNNCVPACQDCNLVKGDLSVEEFRQKIQGMLRASAHGRMIAKYFDVVDEPVVFFFERVT